VIALFCLSRRERELSNALSSRISGRLDIKADAEVMNVDPIAPWYEPVEHLFFGSALERRRNGFLGELKDVRTAISCGEGDGRFMSAFLQSNPYVRLTAVDASWRMTQIGNRRVQRMNPETRARAEYVCADVATFTPPESYDLIATHFFLDCFSTEVAARLIQHVATWAAPDARWIVSEFTQPATPVMRLWGDAVIRGLYAAFRVTTGLRTTHLPDYRPALTSVGFAMRKQVHAFGGLLVSELWERV